MNVPCNGCTLCCRGDLILLHEEGGDDPSLYETETVENITFLKRGSDGNCIYFTKQGCSIYEKRPLICKTFDCAGIVKKLSTKTMKGMIAKGIASKDVVNRGKELLKRGYQP